MLGFENLSGREMLASNILATMLPDLTLVTRGADIEHVPTTTGKSIGALVNVSGDNTWLHHFDSARVDAAISGLFNGGNLTDGDIAKEQDLPTVSGRITSIAADPSDPTGNTTYVGTANGGVWKTTNF